MSQTHDKHGIRRLAANWAEVLNPARPKPANRKKLSWAERFRKQLERDERWLASRKAERV